jgi:hypothetical protein
VLAGLLVISFGSAFGASRALIITGLAGSSENTEDFSQLTAGTKAALIARGFAADQITVLDQKVTRDAILQVLKPAPGDSAQDEYWLVLFGHAGLTHGDQPAFQVSGPRLTADDMKTALDAIPSKQFVMIGANSSGLFLPVLQDKRRIVVSATKAEGQDDQPRFPEKWVAAITENPKATFKWIAARASALVEEEYSNQNLVQAETARLADPDTGEILEPPFGENLTAPPETDAPQKTGPLITASDINIELQHPDSQWEEQAATADTKKIMADAKAVPNPDGYGAIVLDQQMRYTVNEDRTTDELHFTRVYVEREEAVQDWANCFLPQSPPMVTTRLQVARVIRPDGSSLVFNPAKLSTGADNGFGGEAGEAQVFLPNAHAGSVIEIGYQTRQLLDAELPDVTESIPIQREVPIMKTELEARVPQKQTYHVVLKNTTDAPTTTSTNGLAVYQWSLGPMKAAEPLPGDEPALEWQVWLGISSLPSWDEFVAWYHRIAEGSDTIDDTVKAEAAALAQGTNDRTEKMRRAFEFVSSLRYIAIELGVKGFRPRTPAEVLANRYGDCKDKANLLVAMLKCMGIEARFVLLDREGSTDITFPSWQFNHAICFVPKAPAVGQAADLWLDSTDMITPFGYIAPGDYGREALVFGPDKAEFKKIAGTGEDVTMLTDEWDLTEDGTGTWAGTFDRKATGLADYELRAAYRQLSPAQRREQMYEDLTHLWPSGDLSDATISDVSELRDGVEIKAKALNGTSNGVAFPQPAFPWLRVFSAPQRDRPLLLNDGQRFAGTQVVRLHFAKPIQGNLPAPIDTQIAGEKFQVEWQKADDHTEVRTVKAVFDNATVAPDDYQEVRKGVRQVEGQL